MKFLGMKFTRQEWDSLVDKVMSVKGDMVLTKMLKEVLSEIPEDELENIQTRKIDGKEKVVIKNVPVTEEIHRKIKKVAKKKGVELQRLTAEVLLKYWGL